MTVNEKLIYDFIEKLNQRDLNWLPAIISNQPEFLNDGCIQLRHTFHNANYIAAFGSIGHSVNPPGARRKNELDISIFAEIEQGKICNFKVYFTQEITGNTRDLAFRLKRIRGLL